jgi:hypothetical protein
MGFGGSNDAQGFGPSGFEVGNYVSTGIDNDGFAAFLTADEVRCVSERFVVKEFE